MAKGSKLTNKEKKTILDSVKTGQTHRQIATKIKRSKTVVTNFLRDPDDYGTKKPSGLPNKVTARDRRQIIKQASNKMETCSKIKSDLGLNLSRSTIHRVINECPNIVRVQMKKKPLLTDGHKAKRLEWARKHMTWKKE
jgi:transposase